jgi:Protein of unknown function (DUF2442)
MTGELLSGPEACASARREEELHMRKAVDVKPLDNYRNWLQFDDGTQGVIDLSDVARRGVFA